MTSHYRPMLISKKHTISQLILPQMRFMTTCSGPKSAQNRLCSSMQKTHLAWARRTISHFYRSQDRLKYDASPEGLSGPPGPRSGPTWVQHRPQIDRTSTPNRSKIDIRNGVVLAASRSSYCMSFILSDDCRHVRQLEFVPIIFLLVVHNI